MKKKSADNLVTEEYLDVKLSLFKDEIINEVKDIVTESTSKLYTRIDPLLSELEDRRLDRELSTVQLQEIKGQADNHELRIKKLETN